MWHFIYRTLGRENYKKYRSIIRAWKVDVYPSTMSVDDPFFYGKLGVGGVTGKGEIKLYVDDIISDRYDLQNFMMISHELCHMMGMILGWTDRVKLRNDDWGGNKAGKALNMYVQEVHDRHVEGNLWTMNMWSWKKFWKVYRIRVLDIRDLV